MSLSFILESLLVGRLVFTEEDAKETYLLSIAIFALLFFGIFIFLERNIFIFSVASFFLFLGSFSSRLFLKRHFSKDLSKRLSDGITTFSMGVILILFYNIFFKNLLILWIGVTLVIASFLIIRRELESAHNEKLDK
jgi:hypothetical protein